MTATSPTRPAATVQPSPAQTLLLPFPAPGRTSSQSRTIPSLGFLLGRGEAVFDRPFADPAMAARHAEVVPEGAAARVRVLDDQALTRVNGVPVAGTQRLAEGDVLRLGDTVVVYTSLARAPSPWVERPAAAAELTGVSRSIEAVRHSVDAVARHPQSVVIGGETGTGKEIVAQLLHRLSGRSGPFVAVNCGGFSEGLLASELFGHVRGAFTGAVTEQLGLFRAARGGTLLLDEVGEIPLALQPTLLRALETGEIRPVGSPRDLAVDVRIVAASNRELVGLVREGRFRADLYARLAQWVVRLPPLRDRREDIPALCRALLARLDPAGRPLTPDLAEALLVHPWPLNVRGLSNVLAIAAIATPPGQPLGLGPEVLAALEDNRLEHGAPAPEAPAAAVDLGRANLEALLRSCNGKVAEVARRAGISRPRLYRLLWAADLDPATFRVP